MAGQAYGRWYWAKQQAKPQADVVKHILAYRRYRALIPTGVEEINANGNIVYRGLDADKQLGLRQGNANSYDARLPEDWEPHSTWQDADYFGIWVHREKRLIFTYCEGDRTLVLCPSQEEFEVEFNQMATFYQREETP